MIGHDFLRFKTDQIYMCPDLETAHLNLGVDNYPWQCAWVLARNGQIIKRQNFYLNWGDKLKVSDGAARATGFDPLLIKKEGKDPKYVAQIFNEDLSNKDYIIIGHNLLNFDIYVLKQWFEEVGEPYSWEYLNRLIDTNIIAKAIIKGFKPDKDNFLAWQFKLTEYVEKNLKTNLGFLAKHYQLDVDETRLHKADYDVQKNIEIWQKQMWEIDL